MSTRPRVDFRARQRRLVEELHHAGLDALVVTHRSHLRYLTGFSGSAGLLIVSRDRFDLVVDFRYAIAARETIAANQDLISAVTVTLAEQSYDQTLLAMLRDAPVRRIGIEAAYMTVNRFNRLSEDLAASAPTPLNALEPTPVLVPTEGLIERGRVIKDPAEIATLREAARRLSEVSMEVPALVRTGRTETDVAADIDALLRRIGFERPAFETIVASGPNSARPHARPGGRLLGPGDAVVLDFGGVYDGYCVDLTRTVQLEPASPDFRRIYEAVEQAQRAAIAAVRPGVKTTEVDAAARGLLTRYGLGDAFGHGTGHGLGLEIHEAPRIGKPVERQPDPALEVGMVFTVEPGAYLEGICGVRIEDDVLVTSTGCEVLTRP